MFAAFSAACAAVVGYVYFGYPMLVAVLARLRPAPQDYLAQTPPVSLIISAFNEESVLEAKLRNSFAIDYPPTLLEIIVVTDGSDDGTAAVAERVCAERPGARVLHDPKRNGKAAAMLRGADAASAEILVFSDANNMYESDTIGQIVAPFADPQVGAATGSKRIAAGDHEVGGGERAYLRYESFIKKQESRLGCCTAVIGELIAVRRRLMPVFPPGLVNDDFFLAMHVAREGYQVVYVPTAVSLETPAESLQADTIRRRRIAAGRWQAMAWWRITVPVRRPLVVWQVVSHKYLRLLLPFAMAGAFVGSVLDSVNRAGQRRGAGRRRVALWSQVVFYGLPLVGANVRSRPVRLAANVSRYVVRSNLASALGLVHYVRRGSTLHLWQRVERAQDLEKT